MEECVRMMQQTLRVAPSVKKRAKSVYQQRNLGTIKERKKEKRQEKEVSSGETILRILRMRYSESYYGHPECDLLCTVDYRSETSEFISHQLQIMATMQAEQEQRARDDARRKLERPRQSHLPPLAE